MGQLRIVAGRLKGRRLRVPAHGAIRPTPERVREALFSILGSRVAGARVLDAFAGSGALGFEALSRGARELFFVESDRPTAARIQSNARELGLLASVHVLVGDASGLLSTAAGAERFDLVLADPPYAGPAAAEFVEAVERSGVLAASGMLIVERDARSAPVEPGRGILSLSHSRRHGGTRLDFYASAPPVEPPS